MLHFVTTTSLILEGELISIVITVTICLLIGVCVYELLSNMKHRGEHFRVSLSEQIALPIILTPSIVLGSQKGWLQLGEYLQWRPAFAAVLLTVLMATGALFGLVIIRQLSKGRFPTAPAKSLIAMMSGSVLSVAAAIVPLMLFNSAL